MAIWVPGAGEAGQGKCSTGPDPPSPVNKVIIILTPPSLPTHPHMHRSIVIQGDEGSYATSIGGDMRAVDYGAAIQISNVELTR